MPRLTQLTATSCLALCLGAPAALADLTAEEVWAEWKDYMAGFGYDLSGLETKTSDGLSVSGMKFTVQLGEEDNVFRADMGDVRFVEQGDGTVAIEMGDRFDFGFKVNDDETVSGDIVLEQSGHSLVASGEVGAIEMTYSAASMDVTMDGLTIDDITVGKEVFGFELSASDVSSVRSLSGGETREFAQQMSIARLDYMFNFVDPETDNAAFQTQGSVDNMEFSGTGAFPAEFSDTENAKAMLDEGLTFEGGYTFGAGANEATFKDETGSGAINSTSTGGDVQVSFSPDGLRYKIEQTGANINMLVSQMPLPISVAADRVAMDLGIPTVKKTEAQDLNMLVSFEGFSMADALWGLFDPTGKLPRDPATVTVDLSGKAKLLFDYLDPAQAELLEQTGAPPGEMESLQLNTLLVDLAGARLNGSGAFTFDNSDTTTFPGMPKPVGAVDLELKGGNGLLDNLVALGLLPQDQAMGARMMMGLFARPGAGEDTLVSKIEVNDQGHVLANGQRIQ